MIVFDRIIASIQKTGGASILFNELISRLLKDAVPYIEFGYNHNDLTRPNFKYIKPRILERYRKFRFPHSDQINGIFHSTCYRLPSHKKNLKIITTVHDFTYERIIKGVPAIVHTLQKKAAVLNSDIVVCVSENTKNDLFKFIPQIDPNKVVVVYNGASDRFHMSPGVETESYVLYVGQRVSYKNFFAAVEALKIAKNLELVCVGGGAFTKEELAILNEKIPGRFRHLGYVSEEELNTAYNKALCLVYPSFYEGFGIPIVESMKAGCPVIAVRNSSIPEVAGDAAILVEHGKAEEIADAIKQFMHSNIRSQCISKGLVWSSRFSWDRNYQEMMTVYNKLLEK